MLQMKLAITADWLPVFGGAEHVIAQWHLLWPDAPIFTTVANKDRLGPLGNATIHTSSLQWWYNLTGKHQWLLPWMPRAIENIDLTAFDTILSSSHAVGKGIIPPSGARHICYCHTPMRYAWEMEDEYLNDFKVPNWLRRRVKNKLKDIRRWDLTTAARVDTFIANSTTTQERIKRIYNRESTVVHPPVEQRFFAGETVPMNDRNYYLAIGRLVPYKRFDLLIQAANELRLPLKIAGTGQDATRLRQLAGPTVEFLGYVPDVELPKLYKNATALLFPQFEDAGVVPLEAQASGTPVLAFGKGGALDTVRDGVTGIFFAEQTVAAIEKAITTAKTTTFDPATIRTHAERFSAERFQTRMRDIIEQ